MVSSGGAVSENGTGEETNQSLKKGPWTAAEDAILIEYVNKYGEGNWNCVQKNSGLMRCGKSCRLRWANHLRPNLKKGSFSSDEEKLIIELHAKLGNKWARMAAQLPGRTDNEIKNYWNTRMKRRQRAGLPIYPQEFQDKVQHHYYHHHPHKKPNTNTNISSSSLSSLLTSQNPSHSFFNTYNLTSPQAHILRNQPNPFYTTTTNTNLNHQFKVHYGNNHTPYFLNRNEPPVSFPTMNNPHGLNPNLSLSFGSNVSGSMLDPNVFVSDHDSELPSSKQTHTTPSSESSVGALLGNSHSLCDNISNSGLLDALVQESCNLSRNRVDFNCGSSYSAVEKGKTVMEEAGLESVVQNGGGDANLWDNWSSSVSQSSIGMKRSREEMEDQLLNSMDEDLMSLLTNFPMSMPLPEWYPSGSTTMSDVSSESNVESAPQTVLPPTPPPPPPQPTVSSPDVPDVQWNQLNSYGLWNNMPGIR